MLETIWFVLWGVLWAVYFALDGFDLGLGTLMPFLARTESDRRVIVNAMGPFWDGNEVWLIAAGGVTFAAFPRMYAVMFSALYTPLMLLLFALILRGISFEFRRKVDSPAWRAIWDSCLAVGSFVPALLLGVAFANIFRGLPLDASGVLQGNLFTLLNWYGLLGGVLFVLLFAEHGALWLTTKSDGELRERAARAARTLWPLVLLAAVLFVAASLLATPLYSYGAGLPLGVVFVVVTIAALIQMRRSLGRSAYWAAWVASAVTILSVAAFGIGGLYPNLLPSALDPSVSLTAFNSASSPLTLTIMLVVALVMVPIVIAYQAWVYVRFKDRIDLDEAGEHAY